MVSKVPLETTDKRKLHAIVLLLPTAREHIHLALRAVFLDDFENLQIQQREKWIADLDVIVDMTSNPVASKANSALPLTRPHHEKFAALLNTGLFLGRTKVSDCFRR